MGRRAIASAHVDRLAAIYRDHLRRVRWVLRARGIGSHEIDDVVHDVFLAIHRRLDDHEPTIEMTTWVCGVARSVAFAHRRGDARRRRTIAAAPEPDATMLPDDALARQEAWRLLETVLDELPDEQREAFVSIDVLGMRAPEAATLIDAPLDTIYSRLRLARRHCEARLAAIAREDRSAWLGLAVAGELPDASHRRRAWAGIVTALPLGIARTTTASTGLGAWAIATGVAIAVTIGITTTTEEPAIAPATAASPPRAPEPPVPSIMPATLATAPQPSGVLAPPPPPIRRPTPSPSRAPSAPASDDLAGAVEVLRTAESAARRGETTTALAIIDDYRARFGTGPLDRDALRLERRTACDARDPARAKRAHAALVRLGAAPTGEPPCP